MSEDQGDNKKSLGAKSMNSQIAIPEQYRDLVEDLRELKRDEDNPNRMTAKQHEQIWKSLTKYGWVYPVVTNKDGVFADGEQRVDVCLSHKEFYGPVLRLPVEDVDRRLLRQVLNKLKGKHSRDADQEEYAKIVQAGEDDELKQLLQAIGEPLPELLQSLGTKTEVIPETFEIIIECDDDEHQKMIYEQLKGQGYKCRVLIL